MTQPVDAAKSTAIFNRAYEVCSDLMFFDDIEGECKDRYLNLCSHLDGNSDNCSLGFLQETRNQTLETLEACKVIFGLRWLYKDENFWF